MSLFATSRRLLCIRLFRRLSYPRVWASKSFASSIARHSCTRCPKRGRFRVETGRKAYNEVGHIPSAALIELQEDLSDQTSGLRFTALEPTELVRVFKAKGVGDDNDVVLYAGGDPWWATRVWWPLRTIGFDRAAVLDGGFRSGALKAVPFPPRPPFIPPLPA